MVPRENKNNAYAKFGGQTKSIMVSYKLLFLGHRSLIKKITQTAVINIVFQRIFIKLDVSYASQHTFSKVTVTIFENYIYIYRKQ